MSMPLGKAYLSVCKQFNIRVPKELLNPFRTSDVVSKGEYEHLINGMLNEGVRLYEENYGSYSGGLITSNTDRQKVNTRSDLPPIVGPD